MSTIAAPAASYEARPAVIAPVQPIRRAPTLGPNDRCPCGSGKKVKRCCGDAADVRRADIPVRRSSAVPVGCRSDVPPEPAGEAAAVPIENRKSKIENECGSAACCAEWLRLSESASPIFSGEAAPRQHTAQAPSRGAASLEKKVDEGAPRTEGHSPSARQAADPQNNAASAHPSGAAATVPIQNPKSEIENAVPCSPPPALAPLSAEGTGCAAWMRLTGLYPWKPMSLAERREALDRLIRHARRWFAIRKASGPFRPLIPDSQTCGAAACRRADIPVRRSNVAVECNSDMPARPEIGGAGVPARQGEIPTSTTGAPSALADKNVRPPETSSVPSPLGEAAAAKIANPKSEIENDLDAQLFDTLRDAVTIAEPSYELAGELEISEAKLNQLCRERSGLSAREWWDAVRAEDALKLIRAEIESALDGAVLDRRSQIRKRGVQFEDLHRALRQHRRSKASTATERAFNLGFRTPARLNWALWVATGKTMQQHESEILKEIFRTWSYNHQTCSLIAKIAEAEFKPQYEQPKTNSLSNPLINKESGQTIRAKSPIPPENAVQIPAA